jgi:PAS domain S-box-containing protein
MELVMECGIRPSGIEVIGDVPWGTHFGLFYHTKQDLLDILLPFFEAGLRNNEFCIWATAEPLDVSEAKACLAEAMPDFDTFLKCGQIEFISYKDLYKVDGTFDGARVLNSFVDKLQKIRERGFEGLRVTGNEYWLEKGEWKGFIDYEQKVNEVVRQYNMIAVCAYPRDNCDANDVLDVVSTHQFVLSKRNGEWKLIEDQGQKKTRVALRESEERYRGLFESSQDGIATTDIVGNVIKVNAAFREMLGYSDEELKHLTYKQLTPARWHDFEELIIQEQVIPRGYSDEYEKEYIRKDGSIFPISIRTWLIKDGQGRPLGMWAIVRDITERKRADEALRESETKYRTIVETASEGILVADLKGVLTFVNKKMADMVGYDVEEMIGKSALEFVFDEDKELLKERIVRRNLLFKDSYEFKFKRKNGSALWTLVSGTSLVDKEGKPVGILSMFVDITERKRAEDRLRESEEKFRQMAENINSVFWISEVDSTIGLRYVYMSSAFERVFGIPVERIYVDPTQWLKMIYPEDRERFISAMKKRAAGDYFNVEIPDFRIIRPDGTMRWIKARLYPVKGDECTISRFAGIADDVTEHKQAEEALQKSEASLARAQSVAHIGNWKWDLGTNELEYSDECYRLLGYKPGEIRPVSYDFFISHIHHDDKEPFLCAIRESLQGFKPFSIDFRLVRPDGSIAYMHDDGEVLYDTGGNPVGMFGTVQDITERKRAEESLHTTLKRFYNTLSGMYPSILLVTEEGRVEFANPAFCDYFDLEGSPGDLVGLTSPEMIEKIRDVYHHPEVEIARIREIVDRGQPVIGEEVAMRNGRTCLRDFVPLYVDGQRYGRLWLHHDISERKRAEIKLEEAKAQAELYVDLMGHDISNMHQIALGYLEMARDMRADGGQMEFIDKPVEVLQRSARLIKNVRKLQKLRDGAFQTELVDVCKVLADVQREFGAVPQKSVTLNLNGCDYCRVCANELLHDVFVNLVGNAIKHTGDHADITIDLDVVNYKGGRYCRVMVEDNGPGIPDDFKGKIFNRILKGTDKAKGMGLGLYLVKSLVESYDGRVWVVDRVFGDHTKGARFVVMLPATEQGR